MILSVAYWLLLPHAKSCYIHVFRRATRSFRGQGSRPQRWALGNEGEPKNEGSGATSPGNVLWPHPLDSLKMILRMFQLTETMFL